MPDLFHFNAEMQAYFRSLPAQTQDAVMQSNGKFGSLADLKTFVQTNGLAR